MKAFRTKEYGFLLIIFQSKENQQNHIFLLDLWKMGITDYMTNDLSLEQIKVEIGAPQIEFFPISVTNAKMFVNRGLAIAKQLGIKLSSDMFDFCQKHEIDGDNLEGALYRCFNCEKHDLTLREIDEIQNTAKLELKKNIVGTKEEKQYFFVCKGCKNSKKLV